MDLDLMEYANDAAAQAAYVSNGIGDDILTGGTAYATVEYATQYASNAVDNNTSSWWSTDTTGPEVWRYDLGSGVTKTVIKFRAYPYRDSGARMKDFIVAGSNNNVDWTNLHSGQMADQVGWQEFDFSNSTAYRHYRVTVTNTWWSGIAINEFEMMEAGSLQAYSESTIKSEGSYSLKGVATTAALDKTLTRTISSPVDLSGLDVLWFFIRSSRTGSNLKLGIHDSGGTTTELTPVIATADALTLFAMDLTGVSDANKNAIDQIIITIANADSANTFYFDALIAGDITNYLTNSSNRGRSRFNLSPISLG